MTADIEPLVMNNNLFFFSDKRLYIYFQRFEASGQQAYELSKHVPDYLPERFWDTAVSNSQNMIFVIAGENPTDTIFCYRNQIAGEQVIQNAFFKFTTPAGNFESINAYDDILYAVTVNEGKRFVQALDLVPEDFELPRIDARVPSSVRVVSFDANTNTTTLEATADSGYVFADIPYNQLVFSGGSTIDLTSSSKINPNTLSLSVSGAVTESSVGYVGFSFESIVELSTLFLRDDQNNIIPGTLNLRYGVVRHRNTGRYDVRVTRKARPEKTVSFIPNAADKFTSLFDGENYEKDGTFKFSIAGYADDLIIKIVSDYPTPMNLTNLELSGKFKRVSKFLTT